jgi:hypothetical protein
MRVSVRPTTASFRQIISRRFASTEAQNPQVKAAAESASKAYDNALGSAKRVAGPVGEKVGNMLGCEFKYQARLGGRVSGYLWLLTLPCGTLVCEPSLQRSSRIQLQSPDFPSSSSLHRREARTPYQRPHLDQRLLQGLVQRRLRQLLEVDRSERSVGQGRSLRECAKGSVVVTNVDPDSTPVLVSSIRLLLVMTTVIALHAAPFSTTLDLVPPSSYSTTQGLEAYGLFKIGEIIGRRNLVGYKVQE